MRIETDHNLKKTSGHIRHYRSLRGKHNDGTVWIYEEGFIRRSGKRQRRIKAYLDSEQDAEQMLEQGKEL